MSTTNDLRVIEAALREALRRGFVELIPRDDGELGYRLTELGLKHMNAVLDGEEEE